MFRSIRFLTGIIRSWPRRSTSTLRDYQHECIDSIINELELGSFNSLATSIATGGGKTVIFCSMIPRLLRITRGNINKNGIIILVHRKELATQAIDTLKRFKIIDDDRIYLDMADSKLPINIAQGSRPFVIVGSVQSLSSKNCKRMEKYPYDKIHSVIIDECHHAVSNSYLSVLKNLESNTISHPPFILGFSATLSRNDNIPLNLVFNKIVFQKQIHELINENYLCDVKWEKCNVGLNLNEIEVSTGKNADYLIESLADHVINDEINDIVVKTYLKLRHDFPNETKSVLGFCVNVEHMLVLKKIFLMNGIQAECVSGKTPALERESIVKRFKNGDIRILFNCAVFTEGTDIPNIDCIFMLRPTLSKPLLTQMVGRGMRLHHGKSYLRIVDFVDNQSLGLTFKGSLKGKSESLISGTGGMGGSRVNNHNLELPGEADYIKFTNLKGIEDLLNDSKTNPFTEIRKNISLLNKHIGLSFELIKYNLWVCVIHSHSWCDITITKKGEYKLDSVSKFDSMKMGKRVVFDKRSNIIITKDFDKLEQQFKQSIASQELFQTHKKVQTSQQSRMSALNITGPQQKFLCSKLNKVITDQAKPILSIDKTADMIDTVIASMNRWDASKLISHFTIGGKQVFEMWLHKNIFNNKKNREKVTDTTFIEKLKKKKETGW